MYVCRIVYVFMQGSLVFILCKIGPIFSFFFFGGQIYLFNVKMSVWAYIRFDKLTFHETLIVLS